MNVSTNPTRVQVDLILADRKARTIPMDVRSLLANLDPLKLLVEYDEDYQTFAAYCLETGAVATGKTLEEAQRLIKQVLENDFRIAIRTGNLESLFQSSAPAEIRTRWIEAKAASPDNMTKIELEIPADDGIQPKRGVQSDVRIGKTKQSSAA